MPDLEQALRQGFPSVLLVDLTLVMQKTGEEKSFRFSAGGFWEVGAGQWKNAVESLSLEAELFSDPTEPGRERFTNRTLRLVRVSQDLADLREAWDRAESGTVRLRHGVVREAGWKVADMIEARRRLYVANLRLVEEHSLEIEVEPHGLDEVVFPAEPHRLQGWGDALRLGSETVRLGTDPATAKGSLLLEPQGSFAWSSVIRIDSLPVVPQVLVERQADTAAGTLQWRIRLETDGHLRVQAFTAAGGLVELDDPDAIVPAGAFVAIELLWWTGVLSLYLDGVKSSVTAALPNLRPASATDPGEITLAGWGVGQPLDFAHVRYAANAPPLATFEERCRRPLAAAEDFEYTLVHNFAARDLILPNQIPDDSGNGLHGTSSGPQVFVPSETGLAQQAGQILPVAVGLALDVPALPMSTIGTVVSFGVGPVVSISELRDVVNETEHPLRIRHTSQVTALDLIWAMDLATADRGRLDWISSGQWIEMDAGSGPIYRQVKARTPGRLVFGPGPVFNPSPRALTWTIRSAPRYGVPQNVLATFVGSKQWIVVEAGFFEGALAGETFTVSGTASNNKTFTISMAPSAPFDRVLVAETVTEESAVAATIDFHEVFDATILSNAEQILVELENDPKGTLIAHVRGAGTSPETFLRRVGSESTLADPGDFDLASLAALTAAQPDTAELGLLITDPVSVGSLFDQVAQSLDAAWYLVRTTGKLTFWAVAPPPEAPDLVITEHVALEEAETVSPLELLTIRYGRSHHTNQPETLVLGDGKGTGVARETLLATEAGARWVGERMRLHRRTRQRPLRVDLPIWWAERLRYGQAVELRSSPEHAHLLFWVIGIGESESRTEQLCTAFLWRTG